MKNTTLEQTGFKIFVIRQDTVFVYSSDRGRMKATQDLSVKAQVLRWFRC